MNLLCVLILCSCTFLSAQSFISSQSNHHGVWGLSHKAFALPEDHLGTSLEFAIQLGIGEQSPSRAFLSPKSLFYTEGESKYHSPLLPSWKIRAPLYDGIVEFGYQSVLKASWESQMSLGTVSWEKQQDSLLSASIYGAMQNHWMAQSSWDYFVLGYHLILQKEVSLSLLLKRHSIGLDFSQRYSGNININWDLDSTKYHSEYQNDNFTGIREGKYNGSKWLPEVGVHFKWLTLGFSLGGKVPLEGIASREEALPFFINSSDFSLMVPDSLKDSAFVESLAKDSIVFLQEKDSAELYWEIPQVMQVQIEALPKMLWFRYVYVNRPWKITSPSKGLLKYAIREIAPNHFFSVTGQWSWFAGQTGFWLSEKTDLFSKDLFQFSIPGKKWKGSVLPWANISATYSGPVSLKVTWYMLPLQSLSLEGIYEF